MKNNPYTDNTAQKAIIEFATLKLKAGIWEEGYRAAEDQITFWQKDSGAAWDKCEERRIAQVAAEARVASLEAILEKPTGTVADHWRARAIAAGAENAALRERNLELEQDLYKAEKRQEPSDGAMYIALERNALREKLAVAIAALTEISHISRYNDSGEWVDVADEALKKLGVG